MAENSFEWRPLGISFYRRPVLEVARALIGHYLVRVLKGKRLVGRIVETEAYGGLVDPASHSFRGPTERCMSMFGPVGRAYVYFTYGNHYCFNVIAGQRRLAGAVLIRGLETVAGTSTVRRLRAAAINPGRTRDRLLRGEADRELANGPGKLSAALSIDRAWDGHDLTRGHALWVARGQNVRRVLWTPRVGLGKNPAASWFWRCIDPASWGLTRLAKSWPTAKQPRPTLREL